MNRVLELALLLCNTPLLNRPSNLGNNTLTPAPFRLVETSTRQRMSPSSEEQIQARRKELSASLFPNISSLRKTSRRCLHTALTFQFNKMRPFRNPLNRHSQRRANQVLESRTLLKTFRRKMAPTPSTRIQRRTREL